MLLAYAKLSLYDDLLESNVPDDPYLGRELAAISRRRSPSNFPDALEQHRLRREIIATQLANSMINRGGPSLVVRIADQTGAPPASIAAAFAAVRDSYDMTALNAEIDALDNKIPGKLQLELYAAVQDLLLDRLVWFLRNVDLSQGLAAIVEHYRDGIAAVEAALDTRAAPEARGRARRARGRADAGTACRRRWRAASPICRRSLAAPDIVAGRRPHRQQIADVAATYFAAGVVFPARPHRAAARGITVTDYFDRLALDRALDSIGDAERRLAAAMAGNGAAGARAVEAWVAPRQAEVERIRMAVHEIASSGLTLSKLRWRRACWAIW